MGATYKGFYLPSISEKNWSDLVNANWTRIGDLIGGTQSIFLSAGEGMSNLGTGPSNVGGAFPNAVSGFAIDNGVTAGARWSFGLPPGADGVTPIVIRPFWAPVTTDATAHSIQWSVGVKGMLGTNITTAGGTLFPAWTGDSAVRTAGLGVLETGTSTFEWAGGTPIRLNVSRLGADALDTLAVNAVLLGVQIDYIA